MSDVEAWLTCPECPSDSVSATQPAMYNSRFECDDCGENITTGWIYFDQRNA